MSSQCDAWHPVSGPRLRRCSRPARYSLTIEVSGEVYRLYRCPPCRDELVTKVDRDGIEILDETPLSLMTS